jgi:hypothetical protein
VEPAVLGADEANLELLRVAEPAATSARAEASTARSRDWARSIPRDHL